MTREIARNTVLLQSTSLLRGKTQWKWEHFILTELQSTSLLRGKTFSESCFLQPQIRFNPLPSCEGRHILYAFRVADTCFNPLPSCEGRPYHPRISHNHHHMLQSTSLLRGKTGMWFFQNLSFQASIHFPLAREDSEAAPPGIEPNTLQSTSLLRGKTPFAGSVTCRRYASIHFPLAREDVFPARCSRYPNASIHFPLAREDEIDMGSLSRLSSFNPLPSCEGRLILPLLSLSVIMLQSTSLLRGKTYQNWELRFRQRSFNPLPSCEGRLS